jgi:hypothetical protein
MNIGSAFSYVTEDSDWIKKILIGAVLTLTGIGTIAVIGWMLEMIRRVHDENAELLPAWDEIGTYFVDGIKFFVVGFVWSLPLILVSACFATIVIIADSQMSYSDAEITVLITSICFGLVALVYGIVLGLLMPAAAGTLATTGSISQALNPANAFKLFRANIGGFIIASLLGQVIVSIASMIGIIICGVGTYVGFAYGYAVLGNMYGQAYKKAKESLPEAIA